jgi:3-deoxy-D-manno-octulosonic-acid transferase
MSWWTAWSSEMLYRSIEWADSWLGLPEPVSKTLLFRRHWQHYVSPQTLSGGSQKPALWIHGASVGELEDLAGLFLSTDRLARLGLTPESCILTGASASLEARLQQWNQRLQFRYAGPLPPDEAHEIDSFLGLLRPQILVISQNDLWPQLLWRLKKWPDFRGILWLPAGKEHLPFFTQSVVDSKLLGVGFRSQMDHTRWQGRFSKAPLDLRIIGNPRIDRILSRIKDCTADQDGHILTDFGSRPNPDKLSVILGSAWRDDAEAWRQALDSLEDEERSQIQMVVLPHEVNDLHEVASIRQLLPEARVLALEGVLLESYQDFKIAFVGGAFGVGLHNILEPLLWKVPIVSGPKISNQSDAERLRNNGTLQVVTGAKDLADLLRKSLGESGFYQTWKDRAQADAVHFEESRGAIDRLVNFVQDISSRGTLRERH